MGIDLMSFSVSKEGTGCFDVMITDFSVRVQLVVEVEDPCVSEWAPEQLEAFRHDVNEVLEHARESFHHLAISTNRKGHHAYFGITPPSEMDEYTCDDAKQYAAEIEAVENEPDDPT